MGPLSNKSLSMSPAPSRSTPYKRLGSNGDMSLQSTASSGGCTPLLRSASVVASIPGDACLEFRNVKRRIIFPDGKDNPTVPGSPRTPSPSYCKSEKIQSPPPAPKQPRLQLHLALQNHDLVMLVEILARTPALATLPLVDGSFPLKRAADLGCEQVFIDILEHHSANSGTQ